MLKIYLDLKSLLHETYYCCNALLPYFRLSGLLWVKHDILLIAAAPSPAAEMAGGSSAPPTIATVTQKLSSNPFRRKNRSEVSIVIKCIVFGFNVVFWVSDVQNWIWFLLLLEECVCAEEKTNSIRLLTGPNCFLAIAHSSLNFNFLFMNSLLAVSSLRFTFLIDMCANFHQTFPVALFTWCKACLYRQPSGNPWFSFVIVTLCFVSVRMFLLPVII